MLVEDIMVTDLICLNASHSLKDAHDMMGSQGVRHIPVLDLETKQLLAVVTQKVMLAQVMGFLAQSGQEGLEDYERSINIMDVADRDFCAVSPNDDLASVAEFFLDNKHGCLCVTDQDKQLVGIITSSDFVKLAVHLLKT